MTKKKLDENLNTTPIIQKLKSFGYDQIKIVRSNKIMVLTEHADRIKILTDIEKCLKNCQYKKQPIHDSSIGRIELNNSLIKIYCKPSNKQGIQSAGILNEFILFENVRKYLKQTDSLTIHLIHNNKKFILKDIQTIQLVGRNTTNRKKADVIFESANKSYHFSLKKDDSEFWESADTYIGDTFKTVMKKNNIEPLKDKNNQYSVQPSLAIKATKKEKIDVVFGTDLLNNGGVIYRTFSNDDFKLIDNILHITISTLITKPDELNNQFDVYFICRNDKSRTSNKFYPGLRLMAVTPSRITKPTYVLKR